MFAPETFVTDFEALAKLLNPVRTPDQAPAAAKQAAAGRSNPAAVGPRELLPVHVAAPRGGRTQAVVEQGTTKQPGRPQVDNDVTGFDDGDGREVPTYRIAYKQAVCASDAFLGMSGKDPSSACCEELVVRICLPEAQSAAELDLDVRPTRLRLTSLRYKLLLHLPRKLDSDRGRARWDASRRELAVSAPIVQDDWLE